MSYEFLSNNSYWTYIAWVLGIGINIWIDTLGGSGIGPDDQNLHDRANSLIEDRFGSTIQTRT